uniref:Uncharacterized protein n=1 Tax=Anguilla anguilla TaxID=7936 RepID=A0A0E9UJK0_ANGAN
MSAKRQFEVTPDSDVADGDRWIHRLIIYTSHVTEKVLAQRMHFCFLLKYPLRAS